MRIIFTDILPRKNNKIDWKNSIWYKIHFIYDDIEDDLEIINYKNNKLEIKYKNKNKSIHTNLFIRCQLGKILNKFTNDFKIEIGQSFKDNKRNITIIDREYRKINYKNGKSRIRKYYKYHCNICNAELWAEENNIYDNNCACCENQIVVKGINDIATTSPWMIKYFSNIEDAYTHTYYSSKKVWIKCPYCEYEKYMRIENLKRKEFTCPKCSDGISFPEKFMLNLLNNLKELNQLKDFKYQYSKLNANWCGRKRYDFYFELNGEGYIIETHGEQHYRETGLGKLEENKQNDLNKYNLAISNGIKPENYIVIDCRKSELEFIKNNILSSRLNEIFNLNTIDWINIEENSTKNIIKEVCCYWKLHRNIKNEMITAKHLERIFKLRRPCILNYLKIGTRLGWCNYNPEEERSKKFCKMSKINGKQVEIFKDGESLGTFESCNELERQSEKLFGIKLCQSCISNVCTGKRKTHKGYTFKYTQE